MCGKRDRERASERREDQPPKLGARGKERPREEAPDGERLGEVYVARAAAAPANGERRRAEGMYRDRRTEGGARWEEKSPRGVRGQTRVFLL